MHPWLSASCELQGAVPDSKGDPWLGRRHDHCPQKDQNPEHMGTDSYRLESTLPWYLDGLECSYGRGWATLHQPYSQLQPSL